MRISRRALLAVPPVVVGLSACGGGGGDASPPPPAPAPPPPPTYTLEGLNGRIVERLRPVGASVLAATDAGLYQRIGTRWEPRGFASDIVLDVCPLTETHWLASTRATVDAPAHVMRTLDAGATWSAVAHTFGEAGRPEALFALLWDAPRGRLLATGANCVAESFDHGSTWRLLDGQWGGFSQPQTALAVHPGSGDIWYGGQDAIEASTLRHRSHATGVWRDHAKLLPSPSATLALQFPEPNNAAWVRVAAEGGLVETRNGGGTWSLLRQEDGFLYGIGTDAARPLRIVTARWIKEFFAPQPLRLYVSDDAGSTWRTHQHPDTQLYGGVRSLVSVQEAGQTAYLLGLYKGGVMRVELA